MRSSPTFALVALMSILTAACTTGASSPSASLAPSVPPPPSAPAESASPSADACAADSLAVIEPGKLTLGTDNPAYPPYFAENEDGSKTDPWELGDPTNGLGFESAVAYAIAEQLGFTKDQVAWTYVPFDSAYAPGTKSFDIDLNQVSFSAERAEAVDMSDGYYFVNQAVVALADNPVASVTSVADLAAYRFGAQSGTTSLKTINDVIKPTTETSLYDSNDAAIAGLNAKQIDAIVVDLPTAFFMTAAQIDNGKVVGQFAAGADAEHFSVVLPKGSSLTTCINDAIAAITDDGSLAAITKEWLSDKVSAPVFTP